MPYTLAPASEAHYPDLHRAIDIVAREEKFLAFTQAPPFEQSFSFYRALKACACAIWPASRQNTASCRACAPGRQSRSASAVQTTAIQTVDPT